MSLGGSAGRDVVKQLQVTLADEDRAKLATTRQELQETTFDALAREVPGDAPVPAPEALRRRFAAMIENQGRDDTFEPGYVVKSELARDELIAWLQATRAAQLRRLSDEALSDVKMTNALLMVMSYRAH
jgi:hypothetical protein